MSIKGSSKYLSYPDIRQLMQQRVKEMKISIVDVSAKTGIDRTTIHAIIDGKVKDPGISKVLTLLDFLGLDSAAISPQFNQQSQLNTLLKLIDNEPTFSDENRTMLRAYINTITEEQSHRIKSVLIVDDQDIFLQGMAKLFTKSGYHIQLAPTYDDALRELQSQPELAIIDINLSDDRTGIDLLKHINHTYPTMYTIMLSGLRNQALAHQSLSLGAFDYIDKEEDMKKIFYVINRIEKYDYLQKKADNLKGMLNN